MTNARTLTIAGETVTEEDWPESPYFEFDMALDEKWRFAFPDPMHPGNEVPVQIEDCKPYELSVIASVARGWHLDQAEEAAQAEQELRNQVRKNYRERTWSDWETAKAKRARHLASAAKWARIGRNSNKEK